MNNSKQLKLGTIITYFTMAFNMISGLIYTPWMITEIGQNNYGLYTLTTSLITMFVMDFGMSAAVSRFVSKFNAEGNQEAVNNFLGIVYKLYLLIDFFIMTVLVVISFFFDTIYANLSADEMSIFKVLYLIVGICTVVSFPFSNFNGILTAYEQFIGARFADLFHKVFIVVAMVIALCLGYGVYALVSINAISALLTIAIKFYVIKKNTPIKVNFKFFDKAMLKEIFGFSMWTTITAIAQRLIFSITPSIIVAVSVTGAMGSAVFGLASTIEGYIYIFATAISGVFMARISKIVHEGKKDTALTELMIKIGRIQCMVVGLFVVGFVAFGSSFIIDIWNKPDFSESYLCAVFLIIPSFFFLPLEIANTTIVVENKVKLQSMVYVVVGVLNVALSFILAKYLGALGSCISIFVAYMVRTVLMVVIHVKVLHLKMWEFFKATYLKITPWLALSLGVGLLLENFNPMGGGFLRFAVNGVVFVGFFGVTMLLFCMNDYEKNLFLGTFKKILKKIKGA